MRRQMQTLGITPAAGVGRDDARSDTFFDWPVSRQRHLRLAWPVCH